MNFKGKTVLVTGSTSGIGYSIAELFSSNGAIVGICGLAMDKPKALSICKDFSEKGYIVKSFIADVGDEESVKQLIGDFMNSFGKLDILINNAGIYYKANAEQTKMEEWDNLIKINLTGAFLCIKHSIPYFRRNHGGVIINIASEAGIVGIQGQVAYNVSKAGIISLTKSCAVDFAPDGIRVNCVCPGTTETPLVNEAISNSENPERARAELASSRPAKRLGRPEEIAHAVCALADDQLAYATGSIFSIDGGYTAQ